MISRRRAIALAAAAVSAVTSARGTFAQTSTAPASSARDWPNRFVRLIVPFPPGGGTDAITRVLAGKLSDIWGQQAVIDQLAEYKRLGVRHALVEFRRPELGRMMELLGLVLETVRPAVDAA